MSDKPKYDYSDYYYGKYKKLFRSGYFEDGLQAEEGAEFSSDDNKEKHTVIDMRQSIEDRQKSTKRKKGRTLIFTLCIIIMCVCLLFLSIELFSPKGIVGELKTVFGLTHDEGCTNYYAVSMGTFDNVQDARQLADAIRSRGGAGYIVHSDAYNVLASCYLEQGDARKIVDVNNAKIYVIRVFEKDRKSFPSKLRGEFDNTIGYERIVYESLYSISNKLDNEFMDDGEAIQNIMELKSKIKKKTDSFLAASASYTDNYTQEYRTGIIACVAALDNLSNLSLTRPNLICDIRYTYLMVLNLAK